MSMNLYFKIVGENASVEFPFQTTTKLSFKMMDATTLEARLDIMKRYIYDETQWDESTKQRIWDECKGRLNSSQLELRVG